MKEAREATVQRIEQGCYEKNVSKSTPWKKIKSTKGHVHSDHIPIFSSSFGRRPYLRYNIPFISDRIDAYKVKQK